MTVAPADLLPVMQRSHGAGTLEVKRSGGATRIARLHQSGNARIRVPKTYGKALEAVLINTSGGITGGDTLAWTISAAPATETVVTTQACERIYKSSGDTGRQESAIRVGAGASLFWLPQETILFDGGRLQRGLDVSLGEDARFLGLETLVFGREAMGETVASAFFHDRWRIRGADGDLVHADDVRFDLRGAGETADPAVLGGNRVVATLVFATPDDGESRGLMVAGARALLKDATGGASQIGDKKGGKVVIRLAAPSSYILREQLLPVIALFLGERALPKVWSL
ncbi:urease accessory protein UreD [Oricola nitratireducens]|uniref:urease accessory protein UreD n=1 Tax=Oricola nitratireducens TaxID=2775868 RepID=UPI001FEE0591|nr:urease accessory protein UreD [Oricola nitratireducens]